MNGRRDILILGSHRFEQHHDLTICLRLCLQGLRFEVAARAYDRAEADLKEASTVADRSGLRLYQVDALLVASRLHLARRNLDRASSVLDEAREKIDLLGYRGALLELAEAEKLTKQS